MSLGKWLSEMFQGLNLSDNLGELWDAIFHQEKYAFFHKQEGNKTSADILENEDGSQQTNISYYNETTNEIRVIDKDKREHVVNIGGDFYKAVMNGTLKGQDLINETVKLPYANTPPNMSRYYFTQNSADVTGADPYQIDNDPNLQNEAGLNQQGLINITMN